MEACEHIIAEMGAELHDDLIQKLSVLRLHIDRVERSSFDPAETQAAIIRMQSDFQNITNAIRRISRRLLPVRMDDDSFEKSIEILCQNLDIPGALHLYPTFNGTAQKIAPLAEAYLNRMVQELVHNALRHSAAWHMWIRITWTEDALTITVEDDGSGFSKPEEFIARLSRKHNTLRMRAEAIGATITYKQGEKGLLSMIKYPL